MQDSDDTSASHDQRVFLSAEWRDLVMLNYAVEPDLLRPYLPPGTSLDSFGGQTYVSLVAFRFCRAKLFGKLSVPFHTDFEEVNLRFYVRRSKGKVERRGVVFIAEVVPRHAIAATARLLYGENYHCSPMSHKIERVGPHASFEYRWRSSGNSCRISAQTSGDPTLAQAGGLEQFITEHYWGYSKQRSGGCVEYHVAHVRWRVWTSHDAAFEGNADRLYGKELSEVIQRRPYSAFVADGSPVLVFKGNRIQ